MTKTFSSERELKNTSYEIFILLLSLLSIFNLFVLVLPYFDPVIKGVVQIMDAFIIVTFMFDFLYRLFTARSKTGYFFHSWGWADLLASLPVQQLRVFRVFRIVKVTRLLREFGVRNMLREMRGNRAGSALYTVVFLVLIVLQFGGASMVYIEAAAPDSNITSPGDAVWWAFVTITTVGYGDRHPVTGTGRLVGMLVMVLGVGLFGVLTGFLANAFLAPQEAARQDEAGDTTPVDAASVLSEFRHLLEEQERTNEELKSRLRGIEALLNAAD